MKITVGVVAYNEEKNLPSLLKDIEGQSYPHSEMEVVLADSMSTDGTRKVMEEWQKKNRDFFLDIKIIENKGKIQSCGWNAVIDAFTTEALIRIDAHSSIPEDFVEKNVNALSEGEYRIRQNGFQLCMVPGIISYQMIRPSLRKMCRQKYGNGYWVGRTAGICPGCLSLYHFVPFAFVLGIIATTIFGIFVHPFPAVLMWSLYWLLAIVMAVVSVRGQKKDIRQIALPVLFFLLHISYGVGTCFGFLSLLKRGKERKSQ